MRPKLVASTSALVLAAMLSSSVARADDWYGHQTIGADGAASVLFVVGVGTNGTVGKGFLVASAATYLVASPVIHAAHERAGVGVGALGLRVAAPVTLGFLGVALGAASDSHGSWGPPLLGGIIGLGLGVISAMVIDAAVLAKEDVATGRATSSLGLGRELYLPIGGTF